MNLRFLLRRARGNAEDLEANRKELEEHAKVLIELQVRKDDVLFSQDAGFAFINKKVFYAS